MFSQGLGADNGLLFNNGVLITDNRNLFVFFFSGELLELGVL